jgi:O-acetyl-ADP-ribose deacetylase (regulator of RNase III)
MQGIADERIEVLAGDITKLDVDAIVNAANKSLTPGGGVCGAIHRAAGPELAKACAQIGGCETGSAVATDGFKLKARYVIHAVGPRWGGGDKHEDELLASCYRTSLNIAKERGVKSIAFPAISTGVYGFPLERATAIAVDTVRKFLAGDQSVEKVIFAVFGAEAEQAYKAALGR